MSVGGIVKFDQSVVKLNDGYFEVLLIKNPANVLGFQSIVDGIVKRELNRENMQFFHTKSITVQSDSPLDWTLDGEHGVSDGKIEIKNIHNAVRFIVPDKGEN